MREGADDSGLDLLGLRAVGTLFTFFRCIFDAAKLTRLDSGTLGPDERFDIHTWADPQVDFQGERSEGRWGLDFQVPAERKHIMDMLAAIRADMLGKRAMA